MINMRIVAKRWLSTNAKLIWAKVIMSTWASTVYPDIKETSPWSPGSKEAKPVGKHSHLAMSSHPGIAEAALVSVQRPRRLTWT